MSRTFMRFPEGKGKALTFSFDDGVTQDIKLIEIFNKYGIKGTFNINSQNFGKTYNAVQTIVNEEDVKKIYEGQEVAIHGYDHDFWDKIPNERVMYEIFMDKVKLERVSGQIVRGIAYPWGNYDERSIEIAKLAGVVYARVVGSTENFNIPKDWMRLCSTCHYSNDKIFELGRKFTEDTPDNQPYDRDPWLFYVWGHSYEFDCHEGHWEMIEKFLQSVGGKNDIWYATNIEVHDYVENYRHLQFSADGNMVHNPFATDIWLERNRKLYLIEAGSTVVLQ